MYGIPESTLRDRTLGIQPVVVNTENMPHPGPAATFSRDEEIQLVDHLAYMASIGYGYSRQEFLAMVTDFAISLGKRLTVTLFLLHHAIQVLNQGIQMLL